jgi:hypothetical protein
MPGSGDDPVEGKSSAPALPVLEEMLDDIERLIYRVASPYVDDSNPMLHLDELCAECRYKLARIIDAGRMKQCPTRAKFFAYLKVSFQNHVRTQVQKHAFSQKRSGIIAPQNRFVNAAQIGGSGRSKPLHLSLNDEELGLQISSDDESRSWSELIEDLEAKLSPQERAVMQHLRADEFPVSQAKRFLEANVAGSAPNRPGRKLLQYVTDLGMTVDELAGAMRRIRSKGLES